MKVFLQRTQEFISGINDRHLTVYAASGCYYLFMSLVPIVMILCCLLSYTPFSQDILLMYIGQFFSESFRDVVQKIVAAVYDSNSTTLTLSILLALFSASASMKALMRGIGAAYNIRETRNFFIFYLEALFLLVILVFAILAALVILVYGGMILRLLRKYVPYFTVFDPLLSYTRYFVIMVLLAVFFTLIYTLMTAEPVRLVAQIPGAVCAAVTWVLFSAAFSLYISFSDKYGAFGFIGTIMVAMMWMHYCLFFLLIGGYINSYIGEHHRKE